MRSDLTGHLECPFLSCNRTCRSRTVRVAAMGVTYAAEYARIRFGVRRRGGASRRNPRLQPDWITRSCRVSVMDVTNCCERLLGWGQLARYSPVPTAGDLSARKIP